jgi:RNA polymerase sigma-70 factor (ECF subfamily)
LTAAVTNTINHVNQRNQLALYHEIHKDIIDSCKTGNARAQRQLYQLYSRAMYNICYRMMNKREEAEDMLQEAFSEAFMQLHSYRFESSFGAWIKRITVNKCINALKKRKAELVPVDNLPEPANQETDEEIPGLSVERVQRAMEELPEGYRVIFSLYLLEGYDHGEISDIMGISEATSKSQYSRAKQRVREIILSQQYERQV